VSTPGPRRRTGGASLTGRALILVLVAVTLFVAMAGPVRSWFSQRAEIAQLRADVEATRERVTALQIEQERWDDPAFIAAEARKRLHFVLPGEVGYVTLGVGSEREQQEVVQEDVRPWFEVLWSTTRDADAGPREGDGRKAGKQPAEPADDAGAAPDSGP